jgi:hypothetical protein
MVNERVTHIGCGVSTFKNPSDGTVFACNYAAHNMGGWPIYRSGKQASGCKGGPDKVFPGLCKTSEKINPNEM